MPSFCLIIGCSNNKNKNPDLSFCQVPKIITNQKEETEILSTERRTWWLAAIGQADLMEKILENERVCVFHFHSGKAAYLWDKFDPDWVPSLHLGHDKRKESPDTTEKQQVRAQRNIERRRCKRQREEEEAVKKKVAKVDESGERIKHIQVEDEEENLGEAADKEAIVDNDVSTQRNSEELTRSCGTQTEECDYMFRTPKP